MNDIVNYENNSHPLQQSTVQRVKQLKQMQETIHGFKFYIISRGSAKRLDSRSLISQKKPRHQSDTYPAKVVPH